MNTLTHCIIIVFCTVIAAGNINKVFLGRDGHGYRIDKQYRCIAHCFFNVSFDQLSTFVLPQQCQTRFQNSVCHVELNIDYENRIASCTFDYHGAHANMSDAIDIKSGMDMEVREATYNFQRKRVSTATRISFCATDNECDRIYMENHLLHVVRNETWTMFDKISALVYSSSSKNLQCYLNETFVQECTNGNVCRYVRSAQFNDGKPDCHCQSNLANGQTIFFQTHRSKTSPTFSSDLKKYDILNYTCNIDNCNSPTMVTEIKRLINLEVETDTTNSSNSLKFNKNIFLILFFWIFYITIFA